MIGVNYNGLRYELIFVCLFNGIGICWWEFVWELFLVWCRRYFNRLRLFW